MKVLFILIWIFTLNAYALSMNDLFEALKKNPSTRLDDIGISEAELNEQKVDAKLYPKLTLYGKYDNYSTPVGSIPLAPNTIFEMVRAGDAVGQPLGYNIYRMGGSFSMPLFVKSIYTLGEQSKMMKASIRVKKEMNVIQNEAILVGTNANLLYLQSLRKSLNSKLNSLKKTQKFIKIKVETGRMATAELYKIEDAMNQVEITLTNINIQAQDAYAQIESLTEIKLTHALPMQEKEAVTEGIYESLEPLRIKAQALKYGVKAEEERRWWPSLSAHGDYSRSYTKAYNNGDNVYENYGQVGVTLAFALYDAETNVGVDEAKIEQMKVQTQYEKEQLKTDALVRSMLKSLGLLRHSSQLYKKSVDNKRRLRDIAKVSYENGRMNMEDYLRYEDEYVTQEALLYQTQAQLWQTKMKLAVVYGNNIQEMVQ